MSDKTADIAALLASAERVLGLRVNMHDDLRRTGLDEHWRIHHDPACESVKADHLGQCAAHDGVLVRHRIAGRVDGEILTCPFGHTEILVGVFCEGLHVGTLHAGPCWTGVGDPPRAGLVVPPDEVWLVDRLGMLRGLAGRISAVILGEQSPTIADDRRRRVLTYINEHMSEPIARADLAGVLHLSSSRAGHLVRELFGMSFRRLLLSVRLREAALLLSATRLPVGRIAARVGIEDPNYFSRAFRAAFKQSPTAYRREHAMEA